MSIPTHYCTAGSTCLDTSHQFHTSKFNLIQKKYTQSKGQHTTKPANTFIVWAQFSLNWPPSLTQAEKPWPRPLLYLSWNVFHGMQDALGRNSGPLPNLIGICWLIARVWLTRYPVVLCKQDNRAGKLKEHAHPLVRTWYPFPVLDAVTVKLCPAWLYHHLSIIPYSYLESSHYCCHVKTSLTPKYGDFCILTPI